MATPNLGLTDTFAAGDPYPHAQANAVADDLDAAHAAIASVTISVGAESANVIQCTVQVVNLQGNAIAEKRGLEAWLVDSNDASAALCAAAPNGGWAAGVGRLLYSYTANKHGKFITNGSGQARIDITESTAKTFYLVVETGSKLVISSAITFA